MHIIRFGTTQPAIAARFGPVSIPTASEDDLRLANLSGPDGRQVIDHWLGPLPETVSPDATGIQDRADGSAQWLSDVPGDIDVTTQRILLSGNARLSAGAAAFVNPQAFTLVARVKRIEGGVGGGVLIGSERSTIGQSGSISLGPSGVTVSAGASTSFNDSSAGTLVGVEATIAVTFSTARGVTIRRDGIQTAINETRTSPLLGSQIYIGGTGTATSTRLNGEIRGLFYSRMDLSSPDLMHALVEIEQYLMAL